MEGLFEQICLLVTVAFVLTLVPGLRRDGHSLLSMRDQGTALLVFLALGSIEEAAALRSGWVNERIVAACASGLVAGPLVGIAVSVFVTVLAVGHDGLPWQTIGVSMLSGGLVGGWLYWRRPQLAPRPLTGFCLTLAVSWLRNGLTYLFAPHLRGELGDLGQYAGTPLLQSLATALILAVVAQVRARDEQQRAAALAEVRALQARMNPHFLFNALNVLAALATSSPRKVPRAAARLREFLRASFDQQERTYIPLQEELTIVRAYLDIELLRLGDRLQVEETIQPELSEVLVPPFSLQPIVENAVQHGLHSLPGAGRLRLDISRAGNSLEVSVSDDGQGVAQRQVEQIFFGDRCRLHALVLLRRRLQGLFGHSFRLQVCSEVGQGTIVTMRMPLLRSGAPGNMLARVVLQQQTLPSS